MIWGLWFQTPIKVGVIIISNTCLLKPRQESALVVLNIKLRKRKKMEATDVNWDTIFEMLPTQELEDYDERIK